MTTPALKLVREFPCAWPGPAGPDLPTAARDLLLVVAGGADLERGGADLERGGAADELQMMCGMDCRVAVPAETGDKLVGLGLLAWKRGGGRVWAEVTRDGMDWVRRELSGGVNG